MNQLNLFIIYVSCFRGSETGDLSTAGKIKEEKVWLCELDRLNQYTVGADKNGTPVFVHFSAQGASILIISVAIM